MLGTGEGGGPGVGPPFVVLAGVAGQVLGSTAREPAGLGDVTCCAYRMALKAVP